MVAIMPIAIAFSGAAAVALLLFTFWSDAARRLSTVGSTFARELDIAGMQTRPEQIGFIGLAIATALWFAAIVVIHPNPIVGLLLVPMALGFTAYGTKLYLNSRVGRQRKMFQNELEGLLRSIAGGLRAGLGLRQALISVADRSQDPIKRELTRVVGATNMGVPVLDAIDEMSRRFPTTEMQMAARSIRVQSTAGGNLADVLIALADTIRDRRRLDRKISAMTAQGKATAWILGALPLVVVTFVLLTQQTMRSAALETGIGRGSIGLGLMLDALAIFILLKMARLDI